jgi:hypothetical protein
MAHRLSKLLIAYQSHHIGTDVELKHTTGLNRKDQKRKRDNVGEEVRNCMVLIKFVAFIF